LVSPTDAIASRRLPLRIAMHGPGLRKQVDLAPALLWSAAWLALPHLLDTRAAHGSTL